MCNRRIQRRGAVIVQVAISLVVLTGFAALAIDTGRMFDLRGEMQRSVDASALAGAGRLPNGTDAVNAASYNQANHNDVNKAGLIQPETTITIGRWDGLTRTFTPSGYSSGTVIPNAVKVAGFRADVPLYLAGLFGTDTTRVGRSGVAIGGGGKCAGVWGIDGVRVHGDIYTDSYNWNDGAYGTNTIYPNGDLCSCSGIDVMGGVEIHGDVMYDEDYSIDISGNSHYISGIIDDFGCTAVPPPFDMAAAMATNDNDSLIKTDGTDPLRGATTRLMLTDWDVLQMSAGVYYFSDVTVVGQAHIEITSGPVEIYISGDANFGGGGIINLTEKPGDLTVYSTGDSLTLSGGNTFWGSVVAPNADVTVIGGGTIYGTMLGNTLDIGGDAYIHVEESVLLDLYGIAPQVPVLVQ